MVNKIKWLLSCVKIDIYIFMELLSTLILTNYINKLEWQRV